MVRNLMSQAVVDQVLFQLPVQLIQNSKHFLNVVTNLRVMMHVLVLGIVAMRGSRVMLALVRMPGLMVPDVMLVTVVVRFVPVHHLVPGFDSMERITPMRVLERTMSTAVTRRCMVTILEDPQQVLVSRVLLHQRDHPVQRVTDSTQFVLVGVVEPAMCLNCLGRPCRQSMLMIGGSQVTFDRTSRATVMHGTLVPAVGRLPRMRARACHLIGQQDVAVIGCDRP